ncbi:MAG: hypothetical protein IT374_01365 [Polyangiaceae bacterium]|nr:hypothetical protein [Polyangiaceae bacterium]
MIATRLLALLGALGLSSVGCASQLDGTQGFSRDDAQRRAIAEECARTTARSKTAANDARRCVDERLSQRARPPEVDTPERARARREAGCQLEAKPHLVHACLQSAVAADEPSPRVPPEVRFRRDLDNCRTMGKLTFVQACEARVRAGG